MPRPDSLHHTTHYQADTWDDAAIPRTATPVRFQFRRVSVWCDPRPVFAAATWTEELRTLGYYRKVN